MRRIAMLALAGLPFGLALGAFCSLRYGSYLGLRAGVMSGVCFGAAMVGFVEWQRARMASAPVGEPVLHAGPANHLRGFEGVGGWLYLTEARLLFRPHRFNVQRSEVSLPLTDILGVRPRQTALLIPNGIEVTTTSGVLRFVVQGRRKWIDAISARKGNESRA